MMTVGVVLLPEAEAKVFSDLVIDTLILLVYLQVVPPPHLPDMEIHQATAMATMIPL